MTIKEITELVTLIMVVGPLVFQLFIFLAQKSNHQKLENLADRAQIIVTALEQSPMLNIDKKHAALSKLEKYAKEVGIQVTANQLDDYIEAAVRYLKSHTQKVKTIL